MAISVAAGTESRRTFLVALIGCALLLRLLYATTTELLPEETYYWNYSQHLDWGYLDHPPLVAWLIRGSTLLFGNTGVAVRLPALCCGLLTALFVFRLTRCVFGEASAVYALGMTQLLPFFFLSGVLMTPDAPLTAAWAACLYFLERALIGGRSRAWIFAGVAFGFGLIGKYTIGLLGLATAGFMLTDGTSRRWLFRWQPYAAVLIAAAVFAPVVVWNAQHDWASFAFQTSRRLAEAPRFSLHKLIGSALVLLTPWGAVAAVAAVAAVRRAPAAVRASRLLTIAVLVPVAVFAVFSLRHEVKLDWTGAPWTGVLPLIGSGLAARMSGSPTRADLGGIWGWLRAAWPATGATMLLIYGVGLCYLAVGLPGIGYSRHMELVPVGWPDLARQIDAVRETERSRSGVDPLVVGMDRYAIASELAFYSHDQQRSVAGTASAHLFDHEGLMYQTWFPPAAQAGRTLLLVSSDPQDIAPDRLAGWVDRLEPVQTLVVARDGREIRRFYCRVVRGYQHP